MWGRQDSSYNAAAAVATKLAKQQLHGQPHGMFAADECFGGRALNRGIELCAVVEQMYSLYINFKTLGDPSLCGFFQRLRACQTESSKFLPHGTTRAHDKCERSRIDLISDCDC